MQIQAAWHRDKKKKKCPNFCVEKRTEDGESNASAEARNAYGVDRPLGLSQGTSGAESYVEMAVVKGSDVNKTGETQRDQGEPTPLRPGCAPKRKGDTQPGVSVRNPNRS